MENMSRKRLKPNPKLPLSELPHEMVSHLVSFCQFESLLMLRATNHTLKQVAEKVMEKRALCSLPISCARNANDGYSSGADATLQMGWSEDYADRDALIEEALSYADPGGRLSGDVNYDEDRARELLRRRKWVDVEDFLEESGDENCCETPADDESWMPGLGKIGWGVKYEIKTLASPTRTWRRVAGKRITELMNEEGDIVPGDTNVSLLQQCVFSLLVTAQRSSIRHAYLRYAYRHSEYPSGGKSDALMFLTSDNQRVELMSSSDFQVVSSSSSPKSDDSGY
eukprot:CAMPEP_0119022342 /NCGR_PEP_ID=MMETSP1176-20130426/27774_1 /TAXON_ID=265551 /ORGANISM="Synedropsis recta cf, Strain CCMP1620" /LENGTH=282 /DNA_ID=CAMNT_0006977165 /DNA_START=73 /DNA_END=921 /DNA_ORIENTATION=-